MEKTTDFVKETSLDTIESQTQQELLYKGLENNTEPRGDQARAMLEEVAEEATAQAAQAMLALPHENVIDTTRKAKRTNSDGYKDAVTESHQSKKIASDQSNKKLQQMALLFEQMQSLGTKMDSSL